MARVDFLAIRAELKTDEDGNATFITRPFKGDWLDRVDIFLSDLPEGASLSIVEDTTNLSVLELNEIKVGRYPVRLETCNAVGERLAGVYYVYATNDKLRVTIANGGAENTLSMNLYVSTEHPG